MKPFRRENLSRVLILLAAPILLGGGICGSVIRAHVPDHWNAGPMGNFVHSFGDVDIEVGGLVRRDGASFMNTSLSNRGGEPVKVLGAELLAGSLHDRWQPGEIVAAPDTTARFRIEFNHAVRERHLIVILKLSTGDASIEMSEP